MHQVLARSMIDSNCSFLRQVIHESDYNSLPAVHSKAPRSCHRLRLNILSASKATGTGHRLFHLVSSHVICLSYIETPIQVFHNGSRNTRPYNGDTRQHVHEYLHSDKVLEDLIGSLIKSGLHAL